MEVFRGHDPISDNLIRRKRRHCSATANGGSRKAAGPALRLRVASVFSFNAGLERALITKTSINLKLDKAFYILKADY